MSDPSAEPGAPGGGATNVPSSSEKSIANEVKQRVPNSLVSIARAPDNLLLRLNKYVLDPTSQNQVTMLTYLPDF